MASSAVIHEAIRDINRTHTPLIRRQEDAVSLHPITGRMKQNSIPGSSSFAPADPGPSGTEDASSAPQEKSAPAYPRLRGVTHYTLLRKAVGQTFPLDSLRKHGGRRKKSISTEALLSLCTY